MVGKPTIYGDFPGGWFIVVSPTWTQTQLRRIHRSPELISSYLKKKKTPFHLNHKTYPLVMTNIAMERSIILRPIFTSYVCLPKGTGSFRHDSSLETLGEPPRSRLVRNQLRSCAEQWHGLKEGEPVVVNDCWNDFGYWIYDTSR